MTVENIPLRMARDRLDDIPRYELPAPYAILYYLKFGFKPDIESDQDRQAWRSIATKIGRRFDDNTIALAGTTPPH